MVHVLKISKARKHSSTVWVSEILDYIFRNVGLSYSSMHFSISSTSTCNLVAVIILYMKFIPMNGWGEERLTHTFTCQLCNDVVSECTHNFLHLETDAPLLSCQMPSHATLMMIYDSSSVDIMNNVFQHCVP